MILRKMFEFIDDEFKQNLVVGIVMVVVGSGIACALGASVVFASPVGFDRYNASVWRFWNGGPVENVTFVSDDLVQVANRVDRFGAGSYVDCVLRVRGSGVHNWFCTDDFPFDGIAQSDNLTYWQIGGNRTFASGNILGKLFRQGVGDAFVNRTVYWNANLQGSQNDHNWLGFCIKNISIDGTSGDDWINFEYWNGSTRIWAYFNTSSPAFDAFNVTSDKVKVIGSYGIEWKFTDSTLHGATWDGSRLCALDYIGSGTVTGRRQASMQWVDITCSTSQQGIGCIIGGLTDVCSTGGSSVICAANSSGYINTQGRLWYISGSLCSSSGSEGCILYAYTNSTSPSYKETPFETDTADRYGVCASPDSAPCNVGGYSGNNFPRIRYRCRRHGFSWQFMNYSYPNPDLLSDYAYESMQLNCSQDSSSPIANISWPTPGLSISISSINVTANATDADSPFKYPLSNMTLWTNTSGTWTAFSTLSAFPNLSQAKTWQLSGLSSGTYGINVTTCDNNGNCNTTNTTFSVQASTSASGSGQACWNVFGCLFDRMWV